MTPRKALRAVLVPKEVVAHSEAVAKRAVRFARVLKKRGVKVDAGLVTDGALLHDIGRVKTHGLRHGYVGGQMLRGLGFGKKIARIAEVHVAAGISGTEAKRLGLPARDFLPESVEEKLVWYADKLSDKGKVGRIIAHCGKKSRMAARMKRLLAEMELVFSKPSPDL